MSDAHPEFDYGDHLPAGVESFAIHWLSNRFGGSVQHWFNLVMKGAFGKGIVDLRTPGSSKSMLRIPRAKLVEFLNARTDLEAIDESNPQPKPRAARKRRQRKGRQS